MSNVSWNCVKCEKFRKVWCSGSRNDCENILIGIIESLQQEYELTLHSETTLNAANEYKNTIIKDLKQEYEQLQKCYKVTSESWRKLAEENQRLKKILKQSHAALNRAEWLAGVRIDEDGGNKINKAIKAIEEGLSE